MITRFPRNRPPYARILEDWLGGSDIDQLALAENLALDHRISPPRDADFYAKMNSPTSGAALRESLRLYHRRYVRDSPSEAFLNEPLNGGNIVGGAAIHGTSADLELAVVLSLSRLYRAVAAAQALEASLFPDLSLDTESDIDEGAFGNWISSHVLGREQTHVDSFIENFMRALNLYRGLRRHNPAWVTTWKRFLLVRDKGPERWTELVGVPRFASEWLVVLRYRAADAGTLVRPTQLDAGWYGHHFPSPPAHPPQFGGIVVDLNDGPAQHGLTPEYLHEQIDLHLEYWTGAGRLI